MNSPDNGFLTIQNLTKSYGDGDAHVTVLKSISTQVARGEICVLFGPSGSGKSTFLNLVGGLEKVDSGSITVGGTDINRDKKARRDVKWQVGLVFQYPEYQLFEETVFADIAFGPKNMGLKKDEIEERVREAAGFVGVDEALFERSPLELSGGQKRRVAIAGVIAMRPGVLILDEPTAGLDPAGCRQIMDNIQQYRASTGATVIIVSHNMDDAARLTERLIVFDHGHVAMDGTPEQVFSQPEKLISIGLAVPQSTALAMALREKGLDLEGAIFTHEQLLRAVRKLKGVGAC